MCRLFGTALVLLALLIPSANVLGRARFVADDPVVEIPFSFEKGHIVVRAKIKGSVPVELVVETGAEHSKMDGGLLDKYKLPSFYSAERPVTGNNDRLYSFSTVPDVRVGELGGKSLSMRLYSFASETEQLGREIFGSLGADFFRGRIVQFDFKKKVVRFLQQSPFNAGDAVATNTTPQIAVLPMRYKENLTLPVSESVTIEGKKFKTNFDTGILTVVSLSADAAKRLGLEVPPDKAPPRAGTISSLRFAELELKNVPVLLYPKGYDFTTYDKDFEAIAGIALLQNFLVTFDYRQRVIILARY
ncbi:MAG TPA: retropepsin-like aspartic protease [Pyrinomonadaceae bacterium]|jgi:hypothetical protein